MSRPFDCITFDCYGTLVDWRGGITDAFVETTGCAPDRAAALLAAHSQIEPAVQAAGFQSYRDVLTETSRRMAQQLDLTIPPEHQGFLARSLPRWPVFPDTVPALQALAAAGYRLGILSNIDDALLDGTLAGLGVSFDIRVTAEAVRSYKPAPTHFHEAARRIGKLRWLHAGQSWFHDVVPATELSVPVAWVNRLGEPQTADAQPLRVVPDLAALAAWLTGTD